MGDCHSLVVVRPFSKPMQTGPDSAASGTSSSPGTAQNFVTSEVYIKVAAVLELRGPAGFIMIEYNIGISSAATSAVA